MEQNNKVGREFNLNFEEDNIFKPSAQTLSEIQDGKRANIEWTPIKVNVEPRWNSYELKALDSHMLVESHYAVPRNSSQLVRNVEEKSVYAKEGKPFEAYESTPNRFTQATRDTIANSSSVFDQCYSSDRKFAIKEQIPFENRISQGLFSEVSQSQVLSARETDIHQESKASMTKATKLLSELNKMGKKSMADQETASQTHTFNQSTAAAHNDHKFLLEPPKLLKETKQKASGLRLGEKQSSLNSNDRKLNLTSLNSVSLNYNNKLSASQFAIQEAIKRSTMNKDLHKPEVKAMHETDVYLPKGMSVVESAKFPIHESIRKQALPK